MSTASLAQLAPFLNFSDYFQHIFASVGGRSFSTVVVYTPSYLSSLGQLLQQTPTSTLEVCIAQ